MRGYEPMLRISLPQTFLCDLSTGLGVAGILLCGCLCLNMLYFSFGLGFWGVWCFLGSLGF